MDLPSYHRNVEIAKHSALIIPIFGIHPWNASEYEDRLAALCPMIEESPAIGEIGLDFYWVKDISKYAAQLKVFEFFLSAAEERKKLVNIHTKGAEREALDLL